MKTQSNTFLQPLHKTELNQLMEEVKETIATQMEPVAVKSIFCAANFWNIQRMRKPRVQRRFIMTAW